MFDDDAVPRVIDEQPVVGEDRAADSHPDRAFRTQAEATRADVFAGLSRLLLSRREEIAHPDPERAVEFLLVTLGLTLKGYLLQGDRLGTPISWTELSEELQRFAIGYLVPSAMSR